MGRKLPWKRIKDEQSPSTDTVDHSSPRVIPAATPRSNASPSHNTPAPKRRRKVLLEDSNQLRSPSTSPPPERPAEEYMRPGPSADDRYRMVEDELLHIAQKFTAHLHRAEYDRLKAVAKSQNAATIREIERPVVPGTARTQAAKRRQAELCKVKKQKSLGDGATLPETGLRGLLESPRKETGRIRGYGGSTAKTRAAAGFRGRAGTVSPVLRESVRPGTAQRRDASPSRHGQMTAGSRAREEADESTSDEDDLGGPSLDLLSVRHHVPLRPPSRPAIDARPPNRLISTTSPPLAKSGGQNNPGVSTKASNKLAQSNQKAEQIELGDIDDNDPFGITKRQLQRAKLREELRKPSKPGPVKKSSRDIMPSFL